MILNDNRSEQVQYSFRDYRAKIGRCRNELAAGYRDLCHWHDEIELLVLCGGTLKYNINGETVQLREGNGIFVNSRQLHYGLSDTDSYCDVICVLLHPDMLCAVPELREKLVLPVLEQTGFSYRLLGGIGWQGEILDSVREIYEVRNREDALLRIQSLFYRIWTLLYEHRREELSAGEENSQQLLTVRRMLDKIQRDYAGRLTLAEIAEAGHVSESLCCSLFRTYVNTSPMSYVTNWRVERSGELLKRTDLSVTEVGSEVGIGDASYFTKVFRRQMGCTPKEYRKRERIG